MSKRRISRLLGLYGYPGCGKDTIADVLTENGWARVAFADPLKEILLATDPWVDVMEGNEMFIYRLSELVEMYGSLEEVKRNCPEVRRLLRKLGSEGGRTALGENIWCDAAEDRIKDLWADGYDVVVPDVRFPNEAALISRLGGVLGAVVREGLERDNGHVSESHYGSFQQDMVFHNCGTLEEFQQRILSWCQQIG